MDNATQERAAELDVQRLRANVEDWYADRISYAAFERLQRETWSRIDQKGGRHHEAVLEILRRPA